MKWRKKGLIWKPGGAWWSRYYGMMPTPVYLPEQNRIRVYFGTTDKDLFGRITFLEVDADNPGKIVYEHDSFVLDVGEDGTFDDCGVVPSCFVQGKEESLLYTVGFQRCVKVPFMLFAGLAVSVDGKQFQRVSRAPLLPRTPERPFGQGAPCVIKENGRWHMWHWFASGWEETGGKQYYRYHIGCAESEDGHVWKMRPRPCLSPQKDECGVARPWVFHHHGKYHMFFSRRTADEKGISYCGISHAVSDDGKTWERTAEDIISPSPAGEWDSEMTCYAAVLFVKNRWLMFYNGNNNGKTGFGWAELEGELPGVQ